MYRNPLNINLIQLIHLLISGFRLHSILDYYDTDRETFNKHLTKIYHITFSQLERLIWREISHELQNVPQFKQKVARNVLDQIGV